MSAEAAESPGAAAERLKRNDSLYGDAEKVSNDKYHGSGVRISASAHSLRAPVRI
jgi:KUP system potassium uptake protein